MNNTTIAIKTQPYKKKPTLSRDVEYQHWTAKPSRDPKDHKQTAGNEKLVYEWLAEYIKNTPTETLELNFEERDSFELCSMSGWTSNKEIAAALELPVDSVKKAKNLLIRKGWIGQIWFQNNNRSGIYRLGISQAPIERNLSCDSSGKNLPDTTYSIIELNNSPDKTNTNSESNITQLGELKKAKSISQDKLDELNKTFAEKTNQNPNNELKRYWASIWPEVIQTIQRALKFRFKRDIGHQNTIETLLKIMSRMSGREQLARYPQWFIKTESNGQEGHSWGLDFVFRHYLSRNEITNQDAAWWGQKEALENRPPTENQEKYLTSETGTENGFIVPEPAKAELQALDDIGLLGEAVDVLTPFAGRRNKTRGATNIKPPKYQSKEDFLRQLEEMQNENS